MTKLEALKSAKEKANLSKKNQVVFQYVKGIKVLFDYTHKTLWDRRHFHPPITTKVAVVTPDTVDGKKFE
jgi:hypothetical protein